ncbi:MAG TPA: hypothetical protein DCY13_02720, partial [Verrucomicrobiales bacterium]|nr:hypothetical protein [Verrucomicrobiales bacterium]
MKVERLALVVAPGLLLGGELFAAESTEAARITTTVFVNPYFEIREHDQPVKHVYNNDTRVARITGTLREGARIQRLRLRHGWNVCGVMVDGASVPDHPAIVAAFRWIPAASNYEAVVAGAPLAAGTVLWIKTGEDVVVSFIGDYADEPPSSVAAGENLVSAGLQVTPLSLPAGVAAWKFDAVKQRWLASLPGDLAAIDELPPQLAPGEAILVHATEAGEFPAPDAGFRLDA